MASQRQSGCSWWRIRHYKQSTRAPFDKIACLWSSQFLVEDGFRAHQRNAGLEVVYHASEMPNQCFTHTEDNNILKVKALHYLRWLCRQRDRPQSFNLWHFENSSGTMKSYTTWMSHLCSFIFITFFHFKKRKKESKKDRKKTLYSGTGGDRKTDSVLSCFFLCGLCFLTNRAHASQVGWWLWAAHRWMTYCLLCDGDMSWLFSCFQANVCLDWLGIFFFKDSPHCHKFGGAFFLKD